jgi:hypothetical protein
MNRKSTTPKASRRQPGAGVAWFITPHGLGHAARAAAIITACARRRPDLCHHLFTTVPERFFADSLGDVEHAMHLSPCDVGMVQRTPFVEDVDATVRAVATLPLDDGPRLDRVVATVRATGSVVVVSDISPVGLVVARRLGVPGILVANFTWDWIYRGYGEPRLAAAADRLAEIFTSATLTIATEPVCENLAGARRVAPVSRPPRLGPAEVRRRLGLGPDRRVVLISVSGLDGATLDDRALQLPPAATAVIADGRDAVVVRPATAATPPATGLYHPDLVAASDLVIGKLGYSTVAEVFHAGAAFAYLRRPRFPESPVLEAFVRGRIPSEPLAADWPGDPTSAQVVEGLLARPRPAASRPNGAEAAAELILARL